jgi:hypothetical protein
MSEALLHPPVVPLRDSSPHAQTLPQPRRQSRHPRRSQSLPHSRTPRSALHPNTSELWQKLAAAHVDAIITDDPEGLLKWLRAQPHPCTPSQLTGPLRTSCWAGCWLCLSDTATKCLSDTTTKYRHLDRSAAEWRDPRISLLPLHLPLLLPLRVFLQPTPTARVPHSVRVLCGRVG